MDVVMGWGDQGCAVHVGWPWRALGVPHGQRDGVGLPRHCHGAA